MKIRTQEKIFGLCWLSNTDEIVHWDLVGEVQLVVFDSDELVSQKEPDSYASYGILNVRLPTESKKKFLIWDLSKIHNLLVDILLKKFRR